MVSSLGYEASASSFIRAPKGLACLLALEAVAAITLIFLGSNLVGWIIGGVIASITAVSYRAHERAVRKRAGTKYVPSRTISRVVAALLLVSIASGTIHAYYLGSETKLKPVEEEQS